MEFPDITAFYGALLGLVYLAISVWVVKGRGQYKVNVGDGGHTPLLLHIRSHANFAEYVPMAVILLALLELGGADGWQIHTLFALLLLARIAHPFGMIAPERSPMQMALRGPGVLGTWLVLLVACGMLLARASGTLS